ncbi:MAG: hypothetical protein QF903_00615 [Planctomycetota bacterium]|nr:hypothetical protein [Planctomycetota bacterium]MDP6761890.1 hypothetical protein [Planctomycetota bacterium]MDP6987962.1 hypothetical protein [Planctomycetota bacterium]
MSGHAGRRGRRGFALITVILVLAALLVLCTPFLLTARNADRSSSQQFDRRQAELAVDAGVVHARSVLEATHFSLDASPWADSIDEITVTNEFAPDFLDASDATGVMWDLEVADIAGRIDLDSAPPQVLANMIGASSRLVQPVTDEDEEIPLASVSGFADSGFVWVRGELIHYGRIEGNSLTDLERGLGVMTDGDGNVLPGPRPPSNHGVGASLFDQRAFALASWRMYEGDVRGYGSAERLEEVDEFVLDEEGLGDDAIRRMLELGSVHGGARAGDRWQRAARVTSGSRAGETGELRVDSARWFNEGSTVLITDGANLELALVQSVSNSGRVYFDRAISNNFAAYDAVMFVQARRPVNLNTAPPDVLEALFTNLQLRGRNSRITGREARALAGAVIASRPFQGMEDFMRRLVLPAAGIEKLPSDAHPVPESLAAGGTIIGSYDALALYTNGLNANDVSLVFSTMPFSFVTRDTYALDLRSTVNAASGVERFSLAREQVELVVPQVELMHLAARQVDFDETLRLHRKAPWWQTGPAPTSRHSPDGAQPPSRVWSHLGTYAGRAYLPGVTAPVVSDSTDAPVPEHVFASDEETGWAQLWASRTDEMGQREGRVLHFDHETRRLEGRYLPDETVQRSTTSQLVQWAPSGGLMRAMSFSAWIQPRALDGGHLLDVGSSSGEADRLSLLIEGEDLVLRVLDGGGDHLQSAFSERGEVRYALAPGEGPGLPVDTWTHVNVDVRGTRPSQMSMFVDGTTHGVRTPGLTRLTASVGSEGSVFPVDSTEGFAPAGVARVGEELVEYVLDAGALVCTYIEAGEQAGFGGRNARIRWTGTEPPLPDNIDVVDMDHAAGTTVEQYGYSLPIASDVPTGMATLEQELGSFRVGVAIGVENGSTALGDPISIQATLGPLFLGYGMGGADSQVTGLILAPAEDPDGGGDPAEVMRAFSPSGGLAAIVQVRVGQDSLVGDVIGGVEVFEYSGWQDNVLRIATRGDGIGGIPVPEEGDGETSGNGTRRAFVTTWEVNIGGQPASEFLNYRPFVLPISVPVPGATDLTFLAPSLEVPQFAQLTRTDAGELSEWICYDWFDTSRRQLARVGSLGSVYSVLTSDLDWRDFDEEPIFPGPSGPSPPPGPWPPPAPGPSVPPTEPPAGAASSALGSQWQPILGEAEDLDLPVTRAVREIMLFRGVLGTFSHTHPAGVEVHPVWQTADRGVDGGRPGKGDHAFLMGASPDHIGWPVRVHRAHQPSIEVTVHDFVQDDPAVPVASPGNAGPIPNVGFENLVYVALDTPAPEPMVAGVFADQPDVYDTRLMTRLLLHPSGERPRLVTQVAVGGGFRQGVGTIPSCVVDEVVFGHTDFGLSVPLPNLEQIQGSQLVLRTECGEETQLLEVRPRGIRIPLGQVGAPYDFLNELEEDAGLLRIGDEIVAFDDWDASQGTITIAPGGRGMLGTQPQPHALGENLSFLEGITVTALAQGIGAGDAEIGVKDLAEFPLEGTVLIGRELLHYTRHRSGTLEMPRASSDPGMRDERGDGIFRGRFGTTPEGGVAGQPVILFPFRYWDRWAERADAPELAYFAFELAQPAAFWRSFFWIDEPPAHGACDVGVLVRTDPDTPWDEEPLGTNGLTLVYEGTEEGGPLPLGRQSDRVEWRAFVEYQPGAFDLESGFSHAWKTTPRLKQFGAFYLAPGITLRSVTR